MASSSVDRAWNDLQNDITGCRRCPRLQLHGEKVAREKRRAFRSWTYWGKPVPCFGGPLRSLLVVGLAPAAHGAHRTGRAFTGDQSGVWLYRGLMRAGFCNQLHSDDIKDGLELIDATITLVGHCAPPGNQLMPKEILACQPFFSRAWDLVRPRVVLALGQVAWKSSLNEIFRREPKAAELGSPRPAFSHGAEFSGAGVTLLASYHPSQQNTFTGKLTEPMFDSVLSRARAIVSAPAPAKAIVEPTHFPLPERPHARGKRRI